MPNANFQQLNNRGWALCVWRFWIKLSRFDFCSAPGKLHLPSSALWCYDKQAPLSHKLKPKLNYAPLWCLSGVYIHYKLRRSPQKLLSERGCGCAFAGLMKVERMAWELYRTPLEKSCRQRRYVYCDPGLTQRWRFGSLSRPQIAHKKNVQNKAAYLFTQSGFYLLLAPFAHAQAIQ